MEADDRAPGTVIDREFVTAHCHGFDDYVRDVRQVDLEEVLAATGIEESQLRRVTDMVAASHRTVVCWAMGITQHTHAVATIAEMTNVLLLRGMIGKPGAGVCPVRGHSNVQGDRTMGIWEQARRVSSPRWTPGSGSPARASTATTPSRRSGPCATGGRRCSWAWVAISPRHPDTEVTEAALRTCALTVQVSTKLNRSHLVHGRTALILPTLGRTDRDVYNGIKQVVSVEDSMSMVHLSRGSLQPPSDYVRSEVSIVCQLARAVLGPDHPVPWEKFAGDYDAVRDAIAAVVPGCADYNRRVRQPDGSSCRIRHAMPGVPHQHRQSQLRGQSAAVGAGTAGAAGAANPAQPRPVQHHDLRPRRPLPRREGRPPGGFVNPPTSPRSA